MVLYLPLKCRPPRVHTRTACNGEKKRVAYEANNESRRMERHVGASADLCATETGILRCQRRPVPLVVRRNVSTQRDHPEPRPRDCTPDTK